MIQLMKYIPTLFVLGCTSLTTTPATAGQSDDEKVAGERGLPVSAQVPSFMPQHLTGPHAGKKVCPLCTYGLVPQLQIWVQERHLAKGLAIARLAEELRKDHRRESNPSQPVAYVVVVPTSGGKVTGATETAVRDSGLKQVFMTQVPSWQDPETSGLYGHSTKDRPDTRVYAVVNRRLFKRWDSPGTERWAEMAKAIEDSAKFVSTHEITDSQIAPAWEPGVRLEVSFQVVDSRRKPMTGIKVSAVQTDATGHYNPSGWNRRDPRLKAVAWTDTNGHIRFRTIMPGAYATRTEPAHIHFSALVNGRSKYRTLWFEGDPLLTHERRTWAEKDEETVIIPLDRGGRDMQAHHTFVIH